MYWGHKSCPLAGPPGGHCHFQHSNGHLALPMEKGIWRPNTAKSKAMLWWSKYDEICSSDFDVYFRRLEVKLALQTARLPNQTILFPWLILQGTQVGSAGNLVLTLVHRCAGENVSSSNEATISHYQCVRQHHFATHDHSSAKLSTTHAHEGWHHGSILQWLWCLGNPQHLQRKHHTVDAS